MTHTLVVDVCGTLVFENTTHGFLRAATLRRLQQARARVLLSSLGFRAARMFGSDLHRARLITCLSGQFRALLEADAQAYALRTLQNNARASVLQRIRDARLRDERVLLASASLDVVVSAFANAVNADGFVASRLRFDDAQRCQGVLCEDTTGKKLAALERAFGPLGSFDVVTDNPEDRDLMARAQKVHFIRGPHD